MSLQNIYQAYLVTDMLTKRLEKIGMGAIYSMTSSEPDGDNRATIVRVATEYSDLSGTWLTNAQREEKVNAFLELFPDTVVERTSEYGGAPEMKARGVTAAGIHWEVSFGTGVCERIQVGTKKVERLDPDALRDIPRVIVDEPVYEYRCPDPIVAAGLV